MQLSCMEHTDVPARAFHEGEAFIHQKRGVVQEASEMSEMGMRPLIAKKLGHMVV